MPSGPTTISLSPSSALAGAGHAISRRADQVAAYIEQLVADSVLKVGQALPSERRLMERLHCSRSALREGLRMLRARGIIRTEHGRGSFVAAAVTTQSVNPLLHLFASQPRTLYDVLEVRLLLEAEAARLAASRATGADLVLIRRHFERWQAAQHAPAGQTLSAEEHARRDHAFHRAITEAAHNPVLVHTLESLSELMLASVMASAHHLYTRPIYKQQIDRQHQRIFRAVMQRKPEAAYRAAREHVLSVRENLREVDNEAERLTRATLRLQSFESDV
ncbi:transcriptional regulator GlcC [Lampropedia cohaerens]|uniref:transcriptional regulator GlcC n=1 Tax=Lampropedia cohaerens TaxID=1610491 RepID=UPI000A07CF50|nr:transcriptional regulator GlcC [Lampropedia cohaerens]